MARKKSHKPSWRPSKKQKDSFAEFDFNEAIKNMPKEDQDFLNDLGVKDADSFKMLLVMSGIDPDKAYRQALATENEEEFTKSDIMLDDDDPRKIFRDIVMGGIDDDNAFEDEDDAPRHDENAPELEYHIRIKLKNAPVKIWRELKVPSFTNLELLADILIAAMGWENEHLHQFKKGNRNFVSSYAPDGTPIDDSFGLWNDHDAIDFTIGDLLHAKGDRMVFEYDFGDGWEHEIWVKGVREYEADEERVACVLKGHGACPPEDCGGVWGYENLLKIHSKKRKSADEKERLEWYMMGDPDFDPEYFDLEEANDEVKWVWKKA